MNLKKIVLLTFCFILLYSCAEYKIKKSSIDEARQYFSSNGFALIYEDALYNDKVVNKKINNEDLVVMHNMLKTNTRVMITNPLNSKSIETKIYKKANYPNIFNALISKKIASVLELDTDNPYIEIREIKKNKTFIAKEGNIFEEEKNVAEKVPVKEVKMDILTGDNSKEVKKIKKKNNFILVVSDFYYIDSAKDLKNELMKKTSIDNFSIKKINNNKHRLLVGPFKNFSALKSAYISLNNLGFESLNIYID